MALGMDPSIGGVISGLVGAIAAESLTNKKNQNYEAVMNTILAGSMGLGVLLIPLLGIRIDLEAELIRNLLVRGRSNKWSGTTEVLLNFTARKDHVDKVILPSLKKKMWVLCDRFSDSTLAYQRC